MQRLFKLKSFYTLLYKIFNTEKIKTIIIQQTDPEKKQAKKSNRRK